MKLAYRYIIPVLTTIMVLTSCSDELITGENGNTQSEGSRTIAVSFGPQTRTALGDDGLTPEFVGGEMILVSNDETTQECHPVAPQPAVLPRILPGARCNPCEHAAVDLRPGHGLRHL